MARVALQDIIALYRIPPATKDPAIESRTILRRALAKAGTAYPWVKTRGYLTDIALPEADGDIHFFIETEQGAHDAGTPMQTCEIQSVYIKTSTGRREDGRIKDFKQLFGEEVEVTGMLRAWPEHLRSTRQPHLFELHPVLTIGKIGIAPIDFTDRVIWPSGEDEGEAVRTFERAFGAPANLTVALQNNRVVFRTPGHGMQKENYAHVEAFVLDVSNHPKGKWLTLASSTSANAVQARGFALDGTAAFAKVAKLRNGKRYRIGGLAGLDLPTLAADAPQWAAWLSPILSIEAA